MNIKDLYEESIISEAAGDGVEHLELGIIDPEKFIKDNPSTKEITSSIFFTSIGQPDPEGLLSYEIFGLTKEERSGIFGYIDLGDYFIHPLVYKKLIRLNRHIREIVHGTKSFRINSAGELVEDENGNTGIKWLKANYEKLKFKENATEKRTRIVKFIKDNEKAAFMKKLLVIPAYYRDVNTESGGKVSVGEINELYSSIIVNVRGMKETSDYGIDISDTIRGRVQEGILAVYDWICGNNNALLEGSTGLSKKNGIIRRAGLAKTTDFGSRLVISAPNMKVETLDDVMIDTKHTAIPLASLMGNFLPFVIFHIKRYLDNIFSNAIPVYSKSKKLTYETVSDWQLIYSDEKIKEEIDNFIHGYSNRFKRFIVKLDSGKEISLKFKGSYTLEDENFIKSMENNETPENRSNLAGLYRDMTWCDIFYMATVEATRDKHVLITRYPIDSAYSQFPSKIIVSSTVETEPIYVDGKFYQYYPKIRQEDINSNTSATFIDTLRMSNLLIGAMLADYDGDQVSVKGVFTKEANDECEEFINSKFHIIGMDGSCIRTTTNEAIQSLYALTHVLPEDEKKLTQPEF